MQEFYDRCLPGNSFVLNDFDAVTMRLRDNEFNLQMLVSIGSLIGVFIVMWNVYRVKEAATQDEGKRQREQRQLAQMLSDAQHKICAGLS